MAPKLVYVVLQKELLNCRNGTQERIRIPIFYCQCIRSKYLGVGGGGSFVLEDVCVARAMEYTAVSRRKNAEFV